MTAKEYLNRAYVLNNKISKNKEIIKNLKIAATNTSANISDERVQTSAPTGSRMSAFVEMIIEIEATAEKQECELKAVRDEITASINTIADLRQRLVLQLRYLDYYSWSAIAGVLCCSESTVYRLHSCGIEKMTVRDSR